MLHRLMNYISEISRRGLLAALLVTIVCCGCTGNGQAAGADSPAEEGQLEAVFLDVGKGDCILLSMGGQHILVDAGYEETADHVLRELGARGVESVDAMIITHYDKDHVGGAAEIAQRIPVGTFYLPAYTGEEDKCRDLLEMIEEEGLHAVRVEEDTELDLDAATVRVDAALVPYDPEQENDNNASLIVEIYLGEDEWLLPGDIEKDAIGVWLENRTDTFDILKLPHHGKKEKNTDELIETVSPGIAVITDSEEDEAGPKVLKNLEESGAKVLRSSVDGTITIRGDGTENYEVLTGE
ncbi:MAG: MBL fold metallo-hydrolase [Eubacteriales bacterium]|nr:MBL fold metallo-hydrolase [Eubacteriales bacterium]